jgi:hypothetical protein
MRGFDGALASIGWQMITTKHWEYWQHYPEGDAIDKLGRYQWYFHIHEPKKKNKADHGHVHLFAVERRFQRIVALRHLIAIDISPSGLPQRLFTVNGWVTGDAPRSARWSWRALHTLRLNTGHRELDRFITQTVKMYPREIKKLLRDSDNKLRSLGTDRPRAASNRRVEILGSVSLA